MTISVEEVQVAKARQMKSLETPVPTWACGVVGYHARLACERGPVQSRTCPNAVILLLHTAFDDDEAGFMQFPSFSNLERQRA